MGRTRLPSGRVAPDACENAPSASLENGPAASCEGGTSALPANGSSDPRANRSSGVRENRLFASREKGASEPRANRSSDSCERENGSSASNPAITSSTRRASATLVAKTDTQSSERHAGTTPRVLTSPRVGFKPTRSLNAAGTRPEPAVSVPSAKLTSPYATASAEPELEPPPTNAASNADGHAPYGERVPTRPVAN